ncbi:hypothetical protein J6590_003023 [Homalodisca vitripennis]|nr:hypothetical protein J6590_003023 [Homalodisca vitripennis]
MIVSHTQVCPPRRGGQQDHGWRATLKRPAVSHRESESETEDVGRAGRWNAADSRRYGPTPGSCFHKCARVIADHLSSHHTSADFNTEIISSRVREMAKFITERFDQLPIIKVTGQPENNWMLYDITTEHPVTFHKQSADCIDSLVH